MIEVKILDKWRPMTIEQAKRMAWFYVDQLGEEAAENMFHGITLQEMNYENPEI